MDKKDKEFLEDLESLLRKHNVSICLYYDDASDTYGMYDERMVILNNKEEELLSVPGYGMDASDIKEVLLENK